MSVALTKDNTLDIRRLPALSKTRIGSAELTPRYKAAVLALRECHRIDELKDIEDKHSAIAHYAKQIKDDSLRFYAERIRLRAFERIGELLAEIPGYDDRKKLAADNGVSIMAANQAYAAAHIPKRVRDALIERNPPPTRRELAIHGDRYNGNQTGPSLRDWRDGFHEHSRRELEIKPSASKQAYELADYLKSVLEDLKTTFTSDNCGGCFTMTQLAIQIDPEDVPQIKERIISIIELIDEFDHALRAKK